MYMYIVYSALYITIDACVQHKSNAPYFYQGEYFGNACECDSTKCLLTSSGICSGKFLHIHVHVRVPLHACNMYMYQYLYNPNLNPREPTCSALY